MDNSFLNSKKFAVLVLLYLAVIATFTFLPVFNKDNTNDEAFYFVAKSDEDSSGDIKIYPYHDDATGNVYVFLPGTKDKSEYILHLNGIKSLQIGKDTYNSGSKLDKGLITEKIGGEKSGDPVRIEYTKKGEEPFAGDAYFLCGGKVGTLSLVLGDDSIEKIEEDPLHKASAVANYTVYDDSNNVESSGRLKISGHGNSSWTEIMEEFPGQEFKRSYNISFMARDRAILGMNPAKGFVLVSNFYDESELKNYLVLETARALGMKDVPECEYANLYINGKYRGLYLVAQKIKNGNGSLDISSDGYLAKFEYEERAKEGGSSWIQTDGLFAKILYPKAIDASELDEIRKDIQNTEDAIVSGYDELSEKADVDSFEKYFMIQEFFENGDADRTGQYIYKKNKDDKVMLGPIWDFDLSMGNPWFAYEGMETDALWINGLLDTNGWLKKLSDDDEFMEKTYEYYRNSFSDVAGDVTYTLLPDIAKRIGSSWYMDMLRNENGPEYFDKLDYAGAGVEKYDQNVVVDKIESWLVDRKTFWDSYASDPAGYEKEVFGPGVATKGMRELLVMKKK